MNYVEITLPEFDHEMANTRQVLALVPDDKLAWKPHPTMNTIGWNANHLAEIPGWVEGTLTGLSWDVAPVDGPRYASPALTSTAEILALFDQNVAAARKALAEVKEADLGVMWSLLAAGEPLFTIPRYAVIRSFVLSHTVHHRAHLIVSLRLNNITVPGMYGA